MELTYDQYKHASVTSVRRRSRDTDEITHCNRNAASDDERSTSPELVGKVDLDHEGDRAEDVDRNGHVVDLERGKAGPDQQGTQINGLSQSSTYPSPSMIVGRKTPNPLIATDEVKKAIPSR